jgi:ABC-2 type transport system permease protein
VRLAWAHAKAETLQLLRIPAYALATLAFPVVAVLLFGGRTADDEPERLVAGFAATAVLAIAFFQFGVGVATSRLYTEWETFLRTLPAPPSTRLAGRVISALGFSAVAVVLVGATAMLVYDAHLASWRLAALAVALVLGAVPFALLGVAFGYWLPPRAALPAANLLFLLLAIVGSLWARPPDDLPRSADVASQLVPTRSWVEILDSIATGDHPLPLHHVAALVAWSLVFLAFAWWGYRRDEGERFT